MTSHRPERVAELLRSELTRLLQTEMHDPGLGFVTITGVRMSADLRSARVYFSCLGGPEAFARTQETLDRAAGFLRREATHRCGLRVSPELRFVADPSAETGDRIERILRGEDPDEPQGPTSEGH